jgi:hypothetical protein
MMANVEGERIMGEVESTASDVPAEEHPKTLGEELVERVGDVAPGESTLVDDIKHKTAELVDIADGLKENNPRLSQLAVTLYELAEMVAVKAATS